MQWLRGPYGCPHGVGVCSRKHYKDEVCKEWLNGRCERSAQECKFVHDEDVTLFTWNPHNPRCEQFKGPNASWTKDRDGSWQYIHICQPCPSEDLAKADPSKDQVHGYRKSSASTSSAIEHLDVNDISDEMDARISELMKMQTEKKCYIMELKRLDEVLSTSHKEVQTQMTNFITKREAAEAAYDRLNDLRLALEDLEDDFEVKKQEAQQAKEAYTEIKGILTKQTDEVESARAKIKKKLAKIEKKQAKMAGGKTKDRSKEHDERVCCICMENEPCFIFVECGHMCVCEKCEGTMKKCPLCQTEGRARKVFM
tara:strand:+ start:344 stop:1279 length:936 start_codon:yes stop_codon:yes gene_type:complete